MLDLDIQLRVKRILRGERRPDDLDRIFLFLRSRHCGRESVQEIGDFVAHRDQREKGPVTQKARDILVSFRNWLRTGQGTFIEEDIIAAAHANLRIATPEQLHARFGLRPDVVKSVLGQAINKLKRRKKATEREARVFDYLGSAFIWNPAFTDRSVYDDLVHVLRYHKYLNEADLRLFEGIRNFLALYVLALMHGSSLVFENGDTAMLLASHDNKERRLEIKVTLTVKDFPKPVHTRPCLYWTTLEAADHCSTALLSEPIWLSPLEIDSEGFLTVAA